MVALCYYKSTMIELTQLQQVGAQHYRVKQYLGLKNNTKPNPGKIVAIEGIWALSKALAADALFELVFVSPELVYSPESEKLIKDRVLAGVECLAVSQRVMERMVDRDKPDGLAALVRLPVAALEGIKLSKKCRVVVLDGLEIPG